MHTTVTTQNNSIIAPHVPAQIATALALACEQTGEESKMQDGKRAAACGPLKFQRDVTYPGHISLGHDTSPFGEPIASTLPSHDDIIV